jgi:hypothetical protein
MMTHPTHHYTGINPRSTSLAISQPNEVGQKNPKYFIWLCYYYSKGAAIVGRLAPLVAKPLQAAPRLLLSEQASCNLQHECSRDSKAAATCRRLALLLATLLQAAPRLLLSEQSRCNLRETCYTSSNTAETNLVLATTLDLYFFTFKTK